MSLGSILTLAITTVALSAERIEFFVEPFDPVIWVEVLKIWQRMARSMNAFILLQVGSMNNNSRNYKRSLTGV